jgi:type I restriction enzyme R subunit
MNGIPFQPFNPRAPMALYRRNLPHWRQEGCTYFATFRLADSIPRRILLAWQEERRIWLAAHGINGSLRDSSFAESYLAINERERRAFEKRQAHRLHLELDHGHGSCLLERPAVRECLQTALHHFHGERCWCGDWVIMPNHLHWLAMPINGWKLESILNSIKGFVSVQASGRGAKAGRLWQAESYDRIVRDRKELDAFRKYIATNPEKAQLSKGRFATYRAEWGMA